jgi:hypothetical protein
MSSTAADKHLAAAARRRTDPDRFFGDLRVDLEMGGPAETAAAAQHFRARADTAYGLYGLAAPPIVARESLRDYRRRLCEGLKGYSEALRDLDFSRVPREGLPPLEKMLIEDAVKLFEKPEGPMRSCVRRDNAGRDVTHFFGDEQSGWLPFTNDVNAQGQYVGPKRGRIAAELGMGANSCEARAQRAKEQTRIAAGLAMLDAAQAAAPGG